MRILVGCERSGIVRDAFNQRGHDAWSCDTEDADGQHLWGNVMRVLDMDWDIIILHPPCTHLAVSGNRWYANSPERAAAVAWTANLWSQAKQYANLGVCMENPVGVLPGVIGKAAQYIQPWQFGHGETKKTGLWLWNLPKLQPTDIVDGREPRIWKMPPSDDRGILRSVTYQGIADAMAEQWGGLL